MIGLRSPAGFSTMKPLSTTDAYVAIAGVIARYSRAMDTKEFALMDDVFLADARATMNHGPVLEGRAAIVASISRAIGCCGATHHLNGNFEIALDPAGARAHVRSLFRAWHCGVGARAHETYEAFGEYRDIFVDTLQGWRIAERAEITAGEIGDLVSFFSAIGLGVPAAPTSAADSHAGGLSASIGHDDFALLYRP
jgi:hypothetical protein